MMQSEARRVAPIDYFLKLLDDPDFQREFLLSHLSRDYERSIRRLVSIAERELCLDLDSRERQRVAKRFQYRLYILEYERRVARKGDRWMLR